MSRVLLYVDPSAGRESRDLVAVAEEMYGRDACEIFALCPAAVPEALEGVVDHVVTVPNGVVSPHDSAAVAAVIAGLHAAYGFRAIVLPATTFGRMIAPRAAMRIGTGLTADVTGIRHEGDTLQLVRPAFSGRMLASIVNRGDGPVMLTVRGGVFRLDDRPARTTRRIAFQPRGIPETGIELVETRPRSATRDIRESEVLVSGGGGVARSFDRLEALARLLGGMVSASRRVVDSGTAPRHIQVGQSGKTVSPRLYLALGISGSIQHVVGVRNAEHIIAVNSNRNAPICSLADIVVEGDARTFIEMMIRRIERDGTVPPGDDETAGNR